MKDEFKLDAKQLVDMILFNEDVTRDDMIAFEEYVGFILTCRYESRFRGEAFAKKMEN